MRSVVYSMGVTLDGYIVGPDGNIIPVPAPDAEIWPLVMDEIREVDVHLMGRRLYETMLYWETVDPATLDDWEREWTRLWNPLPKVVFSRTLTEVEGNARLATRGVGEEIERLRGEPGGGHIAIGGATLAAEVAALGLIDEYRLRVYPLLVGGGIPYFPAAASQVDLELVEARTLSSGVVYHRHRVVR